MKKLLLIFIIITLGLQLTYADCKTEIAKKDYGLSSLKSIVLDIGEKIVKKSDSTKLNKLITILGKIDIKNARQKGIIDLFKDYFECKVNLGIKTSKSCNFDGIKKYKSLYLTKKEACVASNCDNLGKNPKEKYKETYIDHLNNKDGWGGNGNDIGWNGIISTTIKLTQEAYKISEGKQITNSNIYTPEGWKSFKVYLPAGINYLGFSNNPIRQEEELLRNLTFVPDNYDKKVIINRNIDNRISKKIYMKSGKIYNYISNDAHNLPNKFNKPLNVGGWLYLDVVNIGYGKYLNLTIPGSKPSKDFSLYIFVSMMGNSKIFNENLDKIKIDSEGNPIDNNCIEIIDTPYNN